MTNFLSVMLLLVNFFFILDWRSKRLSKPFCGTDLACEHSFLAFDFQELFASQLSVLLLLEKD